MAPAQGWHAKSWSVPHFCGRIDTRQFHHLFFFFFFFSFGRTKRLWERKRGKKFWPRRDLNTQPSDLESDALPLRHGVLYANTGCIHTNITSVAYSWRLYFAKIKVNTDWPRRDLNTQPSDLESDALPLRHGVLLLTQACKIELHPSQWFLHIIQLHSKFDFSRGITLFIILLEPRNPCGHKTQQSKMNSINAKQGSIAAPHDKYRILNGYPSYTEIFSKRRKIYTVCVKGLSCRAANQKDFRMSRQHNASSILPLYNLKVIIKYHCHVWKYDSKEQKTITTHWEDYITQLISG